MKLWNCYGSKIKLEKEIYKHMKKIIASFFIAGALTLGFSAYAQEGAEETATEEVAAVEGEESTDSTTEAAVEPVKEEAPAEVVEETSSEEAVEEELSFHQNVKKKFIEGDVTFMTPVLLCLIIGMAIAIERIISLNLATQNTDKLLEEVEEALNSGGADAAIEVCKDKRGPVASIFTQGLMRASEGVEMVEKSVVAYGSVQMGALEKGLIWISLFISLAPMLGFMGTVIGMIGAFDAIQAAGDISPSLVAGGIKVALLTTVAGLIAAIILQVFYNYIVSKIESLVSDMEDSSISLIDIMVKKNLSK